MAKKKVKLELTPDEINDITTALFEYREIVLDGCLNFVKVDKQGQEVFKFDKQGEEYKFAKRMERLKNKLESITK